ncbi:MAG: methylenetetrahydrofolate reductase C-terminal domain-containing protein [Candidatus Helarchaeota archaeon]
MIITEAKPYEEIKEMAKDFKKLIVIGCQDCASICQTGGSEQVKEIAAKLEADGHEIVATLMSQNPCDTRVLKRDLKFIEDELGNADAIISMACGLGSQDIAKLTKELGIKVIPTNNTLFMGQIERLGHYYELCCGCDNCVLYEYDMVCPVVVPMVCQDCGRQLAWDAKYCDQCGSQKLAKGEVRKIEA